MSAWHPGRMLSDERDRHDQANAEQIALLKVGVRPMEPWDGADDDAPLADLRQVTPGSSAGCRPESGGHGLPHTSPVTAE